jgi:hypothetical protein
MRELYAFLLVFSCCSFAYGQPATTQESKSQPKAVPGDAISFLSVMVAKTSEDQSTLRLRAPVMKPETRTKIVQVTRMVTETRVRVVTDPNGKNVEQAYEVQRPVMEEITQQYVAYSIVGMQLHEVKIENARAWRITGEPLVTKALAEALKDSQQVFAVEMPSKSEFSAVDPFYAGILNKDAIVIYLPRGALAAGVALEPAK